MINKSEKDCKKCKDYLNCNFNQIGLGHSVWAKECIDYVEKKCKKCLCSDCEEDCKRCYEDCVIITKCEKNDYGWISPYED